MSHGAVITELPQLLTIHAQVSDLVIWLFKTEWSTIISEITENDIIGDRFGFASGFSRR